MKVKYMILHTSLHVPGMGELGLRIEPGKTKNSVGISINRREDKDYDISFKGRSGIIPQANVQFAEIEAVKADGKTSK